MIAEIIIRRDDGTVIVRNLHPVNLGSPSGWSSDFSGPIIEGAVALYGYTFTPCVRSVSEVSDRKEAP